MNKNLNRLVRATINGDATDLFVAIRDSEASLASMQAIEATLAKASQDLFDASMGIANANEIAQHVDGVLVICLDGIKQELNRADTKLAGLLLAIRKDLKEVK